MNYGIEGRRALVIGGSRGLGAASAEALAGEGVHVIAASRSGQVTRDGIEGATIDLADPQSVESMCRRVRDEPVDILVNNCGGPAAGPARDQGRDAWRAAFDAMATPVFALTDAALPGMAKNGWGRVVTIGSSGVVQPIQGLALSNGVRGAIAGWSKTLSDEVASLGITVNMVLPGRIATDRVAELDAGKAERTGLSVAEIQEEARKAIPVGRYGEPPEFAAAVAFLCSAKAGYITGTMIRVDGGLVRGLG